MEITCSMVNTPCETLSNGNGSPIRQNPYKNNIQTLKVNGIIHLGGTVERLKKKENGFFVRRDAIFFIE